MTEMRIKQNYSSFFERHNSKDYNRWVMTDIHGYYENFKALLEEINFSGDGQLIFLGDYVDRGPQPEKVIEEIISIQQEFGKDKVIALTGNRQLPPPVEAGACKSSS